MKGNSPEWEKFKNLGVGGFGLVSLWRNTRTKQLLALKMCKNESGLDSKLLESWCQEVSKMRQLNHPNIVKVHELPLALSEKSKFPILCMEFCTRGDLRKELCQPENICGLPEENIRCILKDVKNAIEYLHASEITHRDLKPENIVLQEIPSSNNSTKIVYKLIDLGFAKAWDQSSLSSTFVGTIQYIAPELFNQQTYSRSIDYWSFGLICHEIITGFRPFLPSMPIPLWMEKVRLKYPEHICIYETADGAIEYKSEIFPENHITQPLKYALEGWLRTALEWDGTRRGKSQSNDSLIIFSSLEAALQKKIVTVFSVKKLERLSYEVDESTLISTLVQWIERDTGIAASVQELLLPSGNSLLDSNKPVLPHLDNDPNLVSMLYVVSKQDGVKLPQAEIFESKHPSLVRKMLESQTTTHSYDVVRRMWANSTFFIESVLESYRGFIEAYSVKMLSLIHCKQKKLTSRQASITSKLQTVQEILDLAGKSLEIDLKNMQKNQFNGIFHQGDLWKAEYRENKTKLSQLHREADMLIPEVAPRIKEIISLQDFEEPGLNHCDKLSQLLCQSRNLYCDFIKLPFEARSQSHNASAMYQNIFQLWEVIGEISMDKAFEQHLQDLSKTDRGVTDLIDKLNSVLEKLKSLLDSASNAFLNQKKELWSEFTKLQKVNRPSPSPSMTRSLNDYSLRQSHPTNYISQRIVPADKWLIGEKK